MIVGYKSGKTWRVLGNLMELPKEFLSCFRLTSYKGKTIYEIYFDNVDEAASQLKSYVRSHPLDEFKDSVDWSSAGDSPDEGLIYSKETSSWVEMQTLYKVTKSNIPSVSFLTKSSLLGRVFSGRQIQRDSAQLQKNIVY